MTLLPLKGKEARLHVRGLCMYPQVRPGDVLCIEPRDMDKIVIGDIAVFYRHGKLFAHRVIEVGRNEGGYYIITRPDNAAGCDDGPRSGADVVGVVTAIERHGRVLDVPRQPYVGPQRIWCGLAYRAHLLFEQVYGVVVSALRGCCGCRWYRFLVSGLFVHMPVSFTLTAPLRPDMPQGLFRRILPEEVKGGVFSWRLMVKAGGKAAGYIAFKRVADQWAVDEVCLRLRYRATSIEGRAWQKVNEIIGPIHVRRA